MKTGVLTINGGSSSIRFGVYDAGEPPLRRLAGTIERLAASDHRKAVADLLDRLEADPIFASVGAIGHRVVHGMTHAEPERITPKLLAELRRITPYDPDHCRARSR